LPQRELIYVDVPTSLVPGQPLPRVPAPAGAHVTWFGASLGPLWQVRCRHTDAAFSGAEQIVACEGDDEQVVAAIALHLGEAAFAGASADEGTPVVKIISQRPALSSLVPLLSSRGVTASVTATVEAGFATTEEPSALEEEDDGL